MTHLNADTNSPSHGTNSNNNTYSKNGGTGGGAVSRVIQNKKLKNERFDKLGLPSPKLNKRYRFSVLPTVCSQETTH